MTNQKYESQSEAGSEAGIEVKDRVETPKLYKVLLLNDDYTPMDFVTLILKRFFNKSEELAAQIMLDVHRKGVGVAGVYSLEIAETKTFQVNQYSKLNQYPLKCTYEVAE